MLILEVGMNHLYLFKMVGEQYMCRLRTEILYRRFASMKINNKSTN